LVEPSPLADDPGVPVFPVRPLNFYDDDGRAKALTVLALPLHLMQFLHLCHLEVYYFLPYSSAAFLAYRSCVIFLII
jgi:hypothetical protein